MAPVLDRASLGNGDPFLSEDQLVVTDIRHPEKRPYS